MYTKLGSVPSSSVDIFADEVLGNPYPAYRELREIGAVVRLTAYDAWILTRYEQVRSALRDHGLFSSAQGVGYEDQLNANMRGTVLASDPPEHDRLRAVLRDKLAPKAVRGLQDRIAEQADELVAAVVERGSFDAVTDLAAVFPVAVVADLIGLPEDVREPLLSFADAAFNTFGVDVDLCEGHGMCELTAPEIFQLDDGGQAQLCHVEVTGESEAAAAGAARVCPVAALTPQR